MTRPAWLARLLGWAHYQVACLRLSTDDTPAAVPDGAQVRRPDPVEPRPPETDAWAQMLERVFGPDPDQWPDHPFQPGDIITITTHIGEVRLATVHNIWFDPSFSPARPMVTTRNQTGTVQWHWPADSCERIDWVPR